MTIPFIKSLFIVNGYSIYLCDSTHEIKFVFLSSIDTAAHEQSGGNHSTVDFVEQSIRPKHCALAYVFKLLGFHIRCCVFLPPESYSAELQVGLWPADLHIVSCSRIQV